MKKEKALATNCVARFVERQMIFSYSLKIMTTKKSNNDTNVIFHINVHPYDLRMFIYSVSHDCLFPC